MDRNRKIFRRPEDSAGTDWRTERFSHALYGRGSGKGTSRKTGYGSYELDVDLPGFKKDEIKVQLKDGYLTLSAAKGLDKDEQDKKGNYIRRERYAGTLSRSFYVGDAVSEEDIHAKYEDGILKLSVPKKAPKAVEEKDGYIAIEG